MAGDPLPHGRERVSGQFLQHVIQTMHGFFGKGPRNRRIVARRSFHARDIKEKGCAGRERLNKDRSRSSYQRWNTHQLSGTHIAHGHLSPIARVHVHTKQAAHDNGKPFSIRLFVNSMAGHELDDRSAVDRRFDGLDRQ